MGRFVVRRDHPHATGGAGQPGGSPAKSSRREGEGIDERLARLVGDGKRVLIFAREAGALAEALEIRGCRTVAGAVEFEGRRPSLELDPGHGIDPGRRGPSEDEDGPGDGRFDAIVVADLLGRIDDPCPVLRTLKERLGPGGSLIVALEGIAPCGGGLAIVDGGPLGAGSGVLFTEEGLLGLLEDAGFFIGHVERGGPTAGAGATVAAPWDCLIVAHPLPVPGLDFLQRRMRELVAQARDAAREADALRGRAALADHRLEILAGQESRMAGRIKDLRAQLLDAHAEMIRRDDEIRGTFGDALLERNALLIERDTLAAERDALEDSLRSATRRLDLFRSSPLGLAYRAIRKLARFRIGRGGPGR